MSLHRSLKTEPSALNQHRNVLTRAERIEKLTDRGDFDEDSSPLSLVKVANRQIITKKKKAEKADEGATTEETVEGEADAKPES